MKMDSRLRVCLVWAMIALAIGAPAVQNEDSPADADLSMDVPMLDQEFDSVNNFCMAIDGFRETVNTEGACRLKCQSNPSCRSYSWSKQGTEDKPGKTCIWTRKFISFDPRWEFHTRTYAVDWTGKLTMVGDFHAFPGMRFIEDRFHKQLKDLDVEQCQAACEEDTPCKGFSYNSDLKLCHLTDSGLRYAPGFTYNERNQAYPGRAGKFQQYPVVQSEAERTATAKLVLTERLLANVDKKARLSRAAKVQAAEDANKLKQIAMAHMAAEAEKKQGRMKEQKKKDKMRAAIVKRDSQSAMARGEYSEMVDKKKVDVRTAKSKMIKERVSKTTLQTQKMNKKATAFKKQARIDLQDRTRKKLISRVQADVSSTKKVTDRLQREIMVEELRAEAFKLGERERMAKRASNLPRKVEKLIKHEAQLRKKQDKVTHTLKATNKKLKKEKSKIKKIQTAHVHRTKKIKQLQVDETKMLNGKGKRKVAETLKMMKEAGPEARLAKLSILDAMEQRDISRVRDFLSARSEKSLSISIFKKGRTRSCMVMGVSENATTQETYNSTATMPIHCLPESELTAPGSVKLPFRFHFVDMEKVGQGAKVGITVLEDITQPRGSNVTMTRKQCDAKASSMSGPDTTPQCWINTPSGCQKNDVCAPEDQLFVDSQWMNEERTPPNSGAGSKAACESRVPLYNQWCKREDVTMSFGTKPAAVTSRATRMIRPRGCYNLKETPEEEQGTATQRVEWNGEPMANGKCGKCGDKCHVECFHLTSPGPRRCSIGEQGLRCNDFVEDVVKPNQKFMLIVSKDSRTISLSGVLDAKPCSFKVNTETNLMECNPIMSAPEQFIVNVLAPTPGGEELME